MNQCTTCNKAFASGRILKRHYSSVAHLNRVTIKDSMFTCKCGQAFKYKSGLFRHKRSCTCTIDEPPVTETPTKKIIERTPIEETLRQELVSMQNKFEKKIHNLTIDNMKLMLKIEKMKSQAPIIQPTNTIRRKLTAHVRNQVKEQQDNLCGICKKEITKIFEIDHVIALQYGGSNVMDNLMALCCECHSKKSIAENKCRYEIKECISSIIEKYI